MASSFSRLNAIIAMLSLSLGACIVLYFFLDIPRHGLSQLQHKRPHIIVIMADDMGRNDVSYHGSNQIPTPNIDALAYNGVIIDNHYVLPICTPSRTAFLTGKYPIRAGMQGYPLSVGEPRAIPLNLTLLPEYLRNLGYATHLVGKWHVGYYADAYLPTKRGFDTFFGYYSGYIKYFTYIVRDWTMGFPGYDLHRDVLDNYTVDWRPKDIYATDLFTDEAENIIANHDSSLPLYLHFSHLAPHSGSLEDGLEVRDMLIVNETFSHIYDDSRRRYAGMVSAMDESVGRVVEALNKKEMLNDSIIIFMSDNGGMTVGVHANTGSNYPYRGLKFSLFEGGVHTPALVWSSLIKNTSRIHKDYFHMTDWLPTLYKLAGGNVDDLGEIDGVDQWKSISEGTLSFRKSLLLNIDEYANVSGAINERFKYLTGASDPYGFYLGDNVNDGDPSAPSYNVTSIMQSMASLAIAESTGHETVGSEKIVELRSANKVVCASHHGRPANCTDSCLFDLVTDPCETVDVSGQYPEVVNELKEFIASYWNVLVPQPKPGVDPRAFPDHAGGPWLPWLTVDRELLSRESPVDNSILITELGDTSTVGTSIIRHFAPRGVMNHS